MLALSRAGARQERRVKLRAGVVCEIDTWEEGFLGLIFWVCGVGFDRVLALRIGREGRWIDRSM